MFKYLVKKIIQRATHKAVGARWGRHDRVLAESELVKNRWWQFKQIRDHIEKSTYKSVNDSDGGFIAAAIEVHGILPCEYGVSIGCGSAIKELALLSRGLVQHFDLYELSEDRCNEIVRRATKLGLTDRITVHNFDAFSKPAKLDSYDLVYWDNSLHHMLDVRQAIDWSYAVLKKGGGVVMNDFVGASRFQWSEDQLDYASRVRASFIDTKYLADDVGNINIETSFVGRPPVSGMILDDPSEAADSDSIIPALEETFSNVELIKTGGVVYHLALNNLLANFDEDKDKHIISLLMMIDDLLVKLGHTHYAVAFCTK